MTTVGMVLSQSVQDTNSIRAPSKPAVMERIFRGHSANGSSIRTMATKWAMSIRDWALYHQREQARVSLHAATLLYLEKAGSVLRHGINGAGCDWRRKYMI